MNDNTNTDLLINSCFKTIKYYNTNTQFKSRRIENTLNIIYFNAISLRNKLDEVELFIKTFSCNIHVIIIAETRLTDAENKFYNIDGYTAFHNNRNVVNMRNRGGGLAIYVDKSISASLV